MLEASDDLDFLQEPVSTEGGRQLRMQNFEGHLAVMLEIFGQVHGGHAARADLRLDRVAVTKCRGETFQQVRHICLLRERGGGINIGERSLQRASVTVALSVRKYYELGAHT